VIKTRIDLHPQMQPLTAFPKLVQRQWGNFKILSILVLLRLPMLKINRLMHVEALALYGSSCPK
jgi:hypothetical protein